MKTCFNSLSLVLYANTPQVSSFIAVISNQSIKSMNFVPYCNSWFVSPDS